jgi:electron transfer flavoprotein beta subunit
MNIVVCAKQVVDIAEMKIDSATKKPLVEGAPKIVNDIDKNAIEEAIKIKESQGGKITVVTVGSPDAKERIKELLAMGADEGILIPFTDENEYHVVTMLLARAIQKLEAYDLILCGEASTDLFSGQVGPKLAGLLGVPQVTYAQKIDAKKDKLVAERNMGDTIVTTESPYPVVVTVTKEINEPRLPSLMQILAAASKPIHEWTVESLGDPVEPKVEILEVKGVSMDRKNVVFKDEPLDEAIHKLVDNLAKEGVLR